MYRSTRKYAKSLINNHSRIIEKTHQTISVVPSYRIEKNLDNILLSKRREKYDRKNVFKKMFKKHALKECRCKATGKKCNCSGLINLNDSSDEYLDKIFENGQFEALYNISLSITNSMKSKAGKDFEDCIEEVFKEEAIPYQSQVFIDNTGQFIEKSMKKNTKNEGHLIDFLVPPPKINTNISDYEGDIISAKTTLRERFHQDKFLSKFGKSRLVIISLEKINNIENIKSIKVDAENMDFTNYIQELKMKFLNETTLFK
jgi:phosphopantetheinyl transferase (holo-ACP synthase)